MAIKLKPSIATGFGGGVLYTILKAIIITLNSQTTVINEIKAGLNAHLDDGSHTTASNTTGANVTANTVDSSVTASNLTT